MDQPEQPRPAVHCCLCKRLIALPQFPDEQTQLTCPFCGQRQQLRSMAVWVTDPLTQA
jgi:hypothetical protein